MGVAYELRGETDAHSSLAETREILDGVVADAATFTSDSVLPIKLDSAIKFHQDVPLYATTFN